MFVSDASTRLGSKEIRSATSYRLWGIPWHDRNFVSWTSIRQQNETLLHAPNALYHETEWWPRKETLERRKTLQKRTYLRPCHSRGCCHKSCRDRTCSPSFVVTILRLDRSDLLPINMITYRSHARPAKSRRHRSGGCLCSRDRRGVDIGSRSVVYISQHCIHPKQANGCQPSSRPTIIGFQHPMPLIPCH